MKRIVLALLCVTCSAQQRQTPQRLNFTGEISGRLTADSGTPISGGYVELQLIPPYPRGKLRLAEWTAITKAGGEFRFDRLNDGTYKLCAQVPKSTWLNPCEWGLKPPLVSLSVVQPGVNLTFALKKGVALPVRVNDPLQLQPENEGKGRGALLLLGVTDHTFAFNPARVVSQDGGGRLYQVTIPFDAPVRLAVSSSFYRLSDAFGLPLPAAGTVIPVTVISGHAPPTIRLQITGKRP